MSEIDVVLRLLAAAVCGIVLGLQRELNEKPVGMRTLALVSLGAAIVTVATLRYPTLGDGADAASRVVQGVIQGLMAGVGFIGAGVILREEGTKRVHGLTTATTVWIAAALGIACGLPDWTVAVTGVVLALAILTMLKWFERRLGPDLEQH
jgi:putative Mg2+ transporter-C (MgtC) family protein